MPSTKEDAPKAYLFREESAIHEACTFIAEETSNIFEFL